MSKQFWSSIRYGVLVLTLMTIAGVFLGFLIGQLMSVSRERASGPVSPPAAAVSSATESESTTRPQNPEEKRQESSEEIKRRFRQPHRYQPGWMEPPASQSSSAPVI